MSKIVAICVSITIAGCMMSFPALAQTTSTYNQDNLAMSCTDNFYGYNSMINRPTTDGQPAYNYGIDIIKTGEDTGQRYRAFVGGRWKSSIGDGDHVLQYTSPYGLPNTWCMWSNAPEFWQGQETGESNTWYANNTLEPCVLTGGGSPWLMYTQVEIESGQPTDTAGVTATTQADRIMLFTSSDCKNWTRYANRGVIVNITNPAVTFFHHESVMYVPWDPDGKVYWLYVCVAINGQNQGYFRIRSSDYTTFDYTKRESSNMGDLGDKMGYLKEAPGGPIFIRIPSIQSGSRKVPAFQFSRNGLTWYDHHLDLEGSDDNNLNQNCYFCGISTLSGTGQLEYCGNNQWKGLYAATTCNSSVRPDIFNSEIGYGTFTITLNNSDLLAINGSGTSSTEVSQVQGYDNYSTYALQASATALPQTGSDWQYVLGDYNHDGIKDLYCIQENNPNGNAEMRILNGADHFTSVLHDVDLPLGNTNNGYWNFFLGDYDGDGNPDLYCICRHGGSGNTEVHVLSESSNFQTWVLHTATVLGPTNNSLWDFGVADYNADGHPDLYCICRNGGDGQTDIHVLDGASNFQSYSLHVASALATTNTDWAFQVGSFNNDGKPDVYCILKTAGTNTTELHVLDFSTNYTSYLLHVATVMPQTNSNWQFCVY